MIAEEFLGGSVASSPDMQRLYLHGYDSYSPDVVPFLLFDLASDAAVPRTLDIPLNWVTSQWSDDSSFVSFIGGSPSFQSRPLLIVASWPGIWHAFRFPTAESMTQPMPPGQPPGPQPTPVEPPPFETPPPLEDPDAMPSEEPLQSPDDTPRAPNP